MATTLSAFYPHVLIHTADVPEPLLDTAIRNACIEFCRSSLWLQQDIDPIPVQVGNNPYEIDVPTGYVVAKVMALYFDNARLTPLDSTAVTNTTFINWQIQAGTPYGYTMFTPNEVTLVYTPDSVGTLTGRMALSPSRTASSVDDTLFQEYQEEIAQGAVARLKSIPNQPFSDPAGAAASLALFKYGVGKARIRTATGKVQAQLMVQMRTRV